MEHDVPLDFLAMEIDTDWKKHIPAPIRAITTVAEICIYLVTFALSILLWDSINREKPKISVKRPVSSEMFKHNWPLTVNSGYVFNGQYKDGTTVALFKSDEGITYGMNGPALTKGFPDIHLITSYERTTYGRRYEDVGSLISMANSAPKQSKLWSITIIVTLCFSLYYIYLRIYEPNWKEELHDFWKNEIKVYFFEHVWRPMPQDDPRKENTKNPTREITYFLWTNDSQDGPYTIEELTQKLESGEINDTSLCYPWDGSWEGMNQDDNWIQIKDLPNWTGFNHPSND